MQHSRPPGRPPGPAGPHGSSARLIDSLRRATGAESDRLLSEMLGVSAQRVSKLARGRAPVRLDEMEAWAGRLGVRLEITGTGVRVASLSE